MKILILVDSKLENWHNGTIMPGIPKQLTESVIKSIAPATQIKWDCAFSGTMPFGKTVTSTKWENQNELNSLRERINEYNPDKILTLGSVSLSMVYALTIPVQVIETIKKYKTVPDKIVRKVSHDVPILNTQSNHGLGFMLGNIFVVGTYNPYAVIKDVDLFRDFKFDIAKLLNKNAPFGKPNIILNIARNAQQLKASLMLLSRYSVVACDTETTGFNAVDEKIEAIGFAGYENDNTCFALVVPRNILYDTDVMQLLTNYFSGSTNFIFHNAKFDLKFIKQYLGMIPGNVDDTFMMSYALDERPIGRFRSHGLKDLSRLYFDIMDYHFNFDEFYSADESIRDYEKLYNYLSQDVFSTIQLYYIFQAELNKIQSLKSLYKDLLIPATIAFVDIELNGVKLNIEYLAEKSKEFSAKAKTLTSKIKATVGESFNPQSPTQVKAMLEANNIIFDDSLEFGTSKDDLMELTKHCKPEIAELIKDIIELRFYVKMNKTYFLGLTKSIRSDGRLSCDFNLAGTATGRLSSSNPNLQNLPSRAKELVKPAFLAEKGNVLLEFDYSQLELRIIAQLARDDNMAKVFWQGGDIHKDVASKAFGKPVEQITDYERFLGKAIDFGTIYGQGAKGLESGPSMNAFVQKGGKRLSIKQCQTLIDEFLNGYPKLKVWIRDTQNFALRYKYVETVFGRRRRFPLIIQDSSHIGQVKRQASNMPVQSVASDYMLKSIIEINRLLPKEAKIILTVHDSVVIECPENLANQIHDLVIDIMTVKTPIDNFLPIMADCKIGLDYGNLKEWKQ